jgi:hypothetical protein
MAPYRKAGLPHHFTRRDHQPKGAAHGDDPVGHHLILTAIQQLSSASRRCSTAGSDSGDRLLEVDQGWQGSNIVKVEPFAGWLSTVRSPLWWRAI